MTTSVTGGYLVQTEKALPGNLTLVQYIQQIIVGMTALPGTHVRPKWQKNAPKVEPQPEDNWCAFGIIEDDAGNGTSYQKTKADGLSTDMQTWVELKIDCSFYGVASYVYAKALRDGFQISQNRDALKKANLGFKETGAIRNVPEVKGQVWFSRHDVTIVLRRQVDKTFAVLSFESSGGTIKGLKDNNEIENVPVNVSKP